MSEKAVFLDKDGTLLLDVPYNVDPAKIMLYPEAGEALYRMQKAGYRLIVISNQSGVALGYFEQRALSLVKERLQELLGKWQVKLDGFYFCPNLPTGKVAAYKQACNCRKPMPGMLLQAAQEHKLSLSECWMIGDILHDVEAGNRAGCRTILLNNGNETEWVKGEYRTPYATVNNLTEAADIILSTH